MYTLIKRRIQESIDVKAHMLQDLELISNVEKAAELIIESLNNGAKMIVCGNGGSASDALHFVGEVVGRFQTERRPFPAIALNADVAIMTAIANDYGYNEIFARQIEAFANPGDVIVGISTSGNSENVYNAIKVSKNKGCKTIALLGKSGGRIKDVTELPIVVPSDVTARIQESHIMIIHVLCEMIDKKLR